MEWIEVSARTLEQAIELALDRLGVVEDELEYVVLDEPRAGLFGIGRVDARIRARVKPVSREKPAESRRRRGRSNGARRGRAPAGTGNGASPERGGRGEGGAPVARVEAPAARGAAAGSAKKRRRRRGGGGGTRPESPAAAETHETETETVDDTATMPLEDQAAAARDFAAGMLEAFGVRGSVETEIAGDDDIEVRVDGDGLGVLVGPRGATLQALEELVRAAVQRAAGGHSARVHLDVGGYRQRRREALGAFVASVAEEVKASGTARALEPMAAPDRKVVHDTIAAIDGVSTISEGEDPRRRVVITPA